MGMSGGFSSIGQLFNGGTTPFNFFQPQDPRAAPSPYSHTPWGGGYFNDAARSGATAERSPYTYPAPTGGGVGGYMGFGGGFGGFNPYANPYARPPAFNRSQPAYMGVPPTETQGPAGTVKQPAPSTSLETPGMRDLAWNAFQTGGQPLMSQGDRRAAGGSWMPYGGGRQLYFR